MPEKNSRAARVAAFISSTNSTVSVFHPSFDFRKVSKGPGPRLDSEGD